MDNSVTPVGYVTRDIRDGEGVKIGELTLPEGTSEETWAEKLAEYLPVQVSMKDLIKKKLIEFQCFGEDLIRDFLARNILEGLSQEDLDALEVDEELRAIETYLRRGSLKMALAAMEELTPRNGITQEVIDEYADKIRKFLGL